MTKNPYPMIIVDEDSGVKVLNRDWETWNLGYMVGYCDSLDDQVDIRAAVKELSKQGYTPEMIIDKIREVKC